MLDEGLRVVSLDQLHESPDNPRTITDERFEALKYSLTKDPDMLQARPIIATPNGEVVCGNIRLRGLLDLGRTEGPAFIKNLSPAQKREWMLRDNQEYGDWVPEELATILAAHREDGADMALLGVEEAQMKSLLKLHDEPNGNPDNPPQGGEIPEVWGIVVECETEDDQAALTERLTDEGFACRPLIP